MAVTMPTGRSLLGKIAVSLQGRARSKGRASKAAAVIGDHAGTMTALGFAVTAMWHLGPFWGWLGTGIAVLVAEFKVRG